MAPGSFLDDTIVPTACASSGVGFSVAPSFCALRHTYICISITAVVGFSTMNTNSSLAPVLLSWLWEIATRDNESMHCTASALSYLRMSFVRFRLLKCWQIDHLLTFKGKHFPPDFSVNVLSFGLLLMKTSDHAAPAYSQPALAFFHYK